MLHALQQTEALMLIFNVCEVTNRGTVFAVAENHDAIYAAFFDCLYCFDQYVVASLLSFWCVWTRRCLRSWSHRHRPVSSTWL